MRLKELVELPEFQKREIVVIGHYNSDGVLNAVLARRGEKPFPVPKLFYLVELAPDNPNPEIHQSEIDAILRHFGYFGPIASLPGK